MDLIEWNDLYFLGGALFLEVELFNWAPLGRFLLGVEVTTLVFMVCGLGLAAQVDVKLVPEAGRWLGPRPIPIWWDGGCCWAWVLAVPTVSCAIALRDLSSGSSVPCTHRGRSCASEDCLSPCIWHL